MKVAELTMQDIGISVGIARKECGFTQEQLANRMGFKHRQTLSQIERGGRKIKPKELVKVMELTGKDLSYFTDPYRLREKPQWHYHIKADIMKCDPEMKDNVTVNEVSATVEVAKPPPPPKLIGNPMERLVVRRIRNEMEKRTTKQRRLVFLAKA